MSLQLVANVFVLAAIYALVSTGYVLIYRVSRVLNLAHGELMMVGAYFLVATAGPVQRQSAARTVLAAICGLVMGIVVYVVLMRWMTGEAVLAAVLITIALGILLRGLAILIWTTQQFYPGATLRLAQSAGAHCAGRADFGRQPRDRAAHRRRSMLGLFVFLQFTPLGRAHAGGGTKPAARRAARHPAARRLCLRLGPFDLHRVARRDAAGARFRRRVDHGDDRAEGVSGGAGRRPRQPAWRR